jgi:4-hydroxy-tetrahydrodipicolinate reductase
MSAPEPESALRVLLVGRGRMGRLVEALCPEFGVRVVGSIGRGDADSPERWPDADVAIDFSTAEAVPLNAPRLAARGVDLVIGTTGWYGREEEVRRGTSGAGVVAAPNFSAGVNLFLELAERAGALMAQRPEFGAWIHELHHAAKRDAPSGTAIAILDALRAAGFGASVDVSSTRAGAIPGTHTLGFDATSETITLTHSARDRSTFARGALVAARWVHGRKGWFTMRDVLR